MVTKRDSSKILIAFALVLIAVGVAEGQSCTAELTNLNTCAEFVVPGAANTNPSSECCGALQAVPVDCLCNTVRIASRLPSRCNIPSFSCGN
ncbi:PREDICTED: protein MEN-8 [Tarenaya hassleriana]|uniref:protein MEN-8 n=1 Tax=Tarenaya hassleriana TaxID=28532 RepID=UPI0008FD1F53|nr:PREDICTED: protein MEN-8 [Tarenaya hassleriana]